MGKYWATVLMPRGCPVQVSLETGQPTSQGQTGSGSKGNDQVGSSRAIGLSLWQEIEANDPYASW
jgi:hypothetical protein